MLRIKLYAACILLAGLSTSGRAYGEDTDEPTFVGLGAGTALGLGPWLSPSLSATVGHRFSSNLYVGGHSAFVFGWKQNDDPVDRMHHHAIEVGWVLGGKHLIVTPGVRLGALFFLSGRPEPHNFVSPTIAVGSSVMYLFEPWYLALDLRLIYLPKSLDRGDTGQGLSAIPMNLIFGLAL